jgi:RNA polymerase sigma-70 factor (ECF subfamily)
MINRRCRGDHATEWQRPNVERVGQPTSPRSILDSNTVGMDPQPSAPTASRHEGSVLGRVVKSISGAAALAPEGQSLCLGLPQAQLHTDSVGNKLRSLSRERRVRELVQMHYDFIYRTLRRLRLPEADAEDAAQEVFLVAFRHLERIFPDSERAFLIGTSLRVAARKRRNIGRRRESFCPGPLECRVDHHLDPEQATEQKRAQTVINEVLHCMSEELRAVFVLFEIEEVPMSEIAQALKLPPGTVASRLRRARAAFRGALKHRRLRDTLQMGATR